MPTSVTVSPTNGWQTTASRCPCCPLCYCPGQFARDTYTMTIEGIDTGAGECIDCQNGAYGKLTGEINGVWTLRRPVVGDGDGLGWDYSGDLCTWFCPTGVFVRLYDNPECEANENMIEFEAFIFLRKTNTNEWIMWIGLGSGDSVFSIVYVHTITVESCDELPSMTNENSEREACGNGDNPWGIGGTLVVS